jgi:hypothetical protein
MLYDDAYIHQGVDAEESLIYKLLSSSRVEVDQYGTSTSLRSYLNESEYVQSVDKDIITLLSKEPQPPTLLDKIKQINSYQEDTFRLEIENLLSFPLPDGKHVIGDILHNSLIEIKSHYQVELKFLTILAFGVAAAVYYAGLMAKKLGIKNNNIDLKFTGNGAKILNWLKVDNDSVKMNNFLKYIYYSAFLGDDFKEDELNTSYKFSCGFTDSPKLEAAYGMLKGSSLDIKSISSVTLAGENLAYTDQDNSKKTLTVADELTRQLLTRVENAQFTTNVRIDDVELSEFTNFCKSFNNAIVNSYGTDVLYLMPIDLSKLIDPTINTTVYGNQLFDFNTDIFINNRRDNIQKFLMSLISSDTSKIELKSFFFIEVQALIEGLQSNMNGGIITKI